MINTGQQPIKRHKYSDLLVGICVDIYVGSHCGFRATSKIIRCLNERLGWGLASTPSMGSIKNWVEKSGYSIYNEPKEKFQDDDYAIITDESMMLGSEKLLLTLGVKSNKDNQGALSFQEIDVLDISVKRSWNGEKIKDVLANIENKAKKAPSYVLSDNANTISKAVKNKGYKHIRDVGHTLAMFIERKYKNNDMFIAYTKAIAGVKVRENMKPTGYLLPPKQRAIARFMNIAPIIQWSKQILKCYDKLPENEQLVFSFIKGHRQIVEELNEIILACRDISDCLKNNGLSYKTIKHCLETVKPMQNSKIQGVVDISKSFGQYLIELKDNLPDKDAIWHVSSDIIESCFGCYKSRMSCNLLDGVTRHVLILPILTRLAPKTGIININYKNALEQYLLSDLSRWSVDNLSDSMTVKRRKMLKAA